MKLNKKYIALNNLIILQRGFDLPEIERVIGNIPVVASTGIIGSHNIAKVKGPGVVIGRSGSIGGGQYVAGDFWPLNTTLWVKDFKEHNPRFIYYVLKNIDFSRFNFGTGVPTLNRNHIANIKVLAFDKSQEEKIADILSKYDDLIENNRRRIELLERSARLLYKEWFVRLRFPGHEHTPIIDGIPEGWERLKLGEVLTLQRGFDLPSAKRTHGQYPIFASTGINGYHEKAKVQAPGIVTGRSGSLGKVMYIAEDFWPLNTTLYVKDFIKVDAVFALHLLENLHLEQYNSGAAVPTLNRNDIHKIKVLCPSCTLKSLFLAFANPIYTQIHFLDRYNQKLKQARDILLPKLMNGEIEV
ncbi:Type I restriction-modification system specificity subunit [Microcystis aeruginosa PCC 9809]|jgi:type I restriction enzyme S subunit|uniref:Type I restriction-modification system specificity subunit n=1 Tax=Microcystis aeruginosa PCC 9809 TaxID=1160285 RepID=I4HQN7_MICAE|nr:restriction endonuclease subunit S [Microcystis aeruginosa]CCI24361.1 Type I restriction-modification system specificity subunit [Microcystis aeruginosa PCC 9809]